LTTFSFEVILSKKTTSEFKNLNFETTSEKTANMKVVGIEEL
jgi:hypothetical protein